MCGAVFLMAISVGCAHLRPKVESARGRGRAAVAHAGAGGQAYKASDPDASFTFFNGHVESLPTTAKPTVLDYARPILESLGLSTTPRVPLKLPAPIASAQTAKPARDLDADLDVALPMLRETEQAVAPASRGDSDDPVRSDGKRPHRGHAPAAGRRSPAARRLGAPARRRRRAGAASGPADPARVPREEPGPLRGRARGGRRRAAADALPGRRLLPEGSVRAARMPATSDSSTAARSCTSTAIGTSSASAG